MTEYRNPFMEIMSALPEPTPQERLEYLRTEIEAERISYSELAELQGLAEYIDPDDVQLLEWAGVPEHKESDNE